MFISTLTPGLVYVNTSLKQLIYSLREVPFKKRKKVLNELLKAEKIILSKDYLKEHFDIDVSISWCVDKTTEFLPSMEELIQQSIQFFLQVFFKDLAKKLFITDSFNIEFSLGCSCRKLQLELSAAIILWLKSFGFTEPNIQVFFHADRISFKFYPFKNPRVTPE